MKIKAYRSTMPFDNRSNGGMPSISPTTNKSVLPTNNVPAIVDILNGTVSIKDVYPGTRGNWAPGEDVSKDYKDPGDDYKRLERDYDILQEMSKMPPPSTEKWKVKVPGGAKVCTTYQEAIKYKRLLKEKGVQYAYLSRVAQVEPQQDRVELISEALPKTFMVESIDVSQGVKETGAAFCVAPNHFITCAHVIKKYNKYDTTRDRDLSKGVMVSLIHGGAKHRAMVVATDPLWDLALIKCEIAVEPFQLDTTINIGEEIIAVGSPHGYENNVSVGNVGSVDRKVYYYQDAPSYFFVDLAIYPGNSGGPILREANGKVIGMVTLIVSSAGGYGLNASLPAKYIVSFCENHIKGFRIDKSQ